MTQEDQVFITNVVVTNLTQEMVASSVISWPASVTVKLSTIAKIYKYKGLHEGHHFIPMAMEVHNSPNRNMDRFIRECAHLFHNKWSKGHLSLSFCIQFFSQHVNIALQHALASTIERKIMLLSDASYKPPLLLDLMICMQVTLEGLWVR
jgi:hypothetical protein